MTDFFNNRKVVIATRHHKEEVIAPLLEKALGVNCFVPEHFDSDIFGTFSGEVERLEDPIPTLRKKCELATEQSHCDLAIASEGSFGSHPSLFFVQADDELVMLLDKKNELEIVAREISTVTNFNAQEVTSENELLAFAKKSLFPAHGIILKKSRANFSEMVKGICSVDELLNSYHRLKDRKGYVYAETDMRALYNPSRMRVIEQATIKLISKIKSSCPKCSTPGFSITDTVSGLPCETCNSPTRSALSHIYQCQKCGYQEEKKYPLGKKYENPQHCNWCNP